MEVVELSKEDAADLEALMKFVWPKVHGYPDKWRRKRMLSREEIEEEMGGGFHYFGIRIDGKLAGFYKFSVTKQGLYGEHQTIDPNYGGRGMASKMYDQFIEESRRRGVPIYVNILLHDEVGLKLVTRHGFHKKGQEYQQSEGMWVQIWERAP